MNKLIQTPKNLSKSINKTSEKKPDQNNSTGNMKMVNGVVVMLPPNEDTAIESLTEKEIEAEIEKKQDTITVDASTNLEDVQHVFDAESEEKSNKLAAKTRAENEERAKEAAIETTPKKVGNSIVAHSTSYDDIDLFATRLQEKDEEESAG